MNILAFNGSPHKDGNTAVVINILLEGFKEAGADIQIFHTSELNINSCKGCRVCMNKKGCIINDDMQLIYTAFKNADTIIIGTPNYMGQMSGQTKIFIDRLSAEVSPRFSPKFKEENAGKKLIIVFTQGNPNTNIFKTYYDYIKDSFALLEFKVEDIIVAAGTRSEKAGENKELYDKIKAIGKSLVI